MGLMLERGGSWSGLERNVAFLNTRDGRFAESAGLFGLDFDDDGRAVALVDWDGDGDMDLWVANRTGPRLRLLRNEVRDAAPFVAFRLRGEKANRDGIGARVELRTADGAVLGARTLRAGEGYLAQSSKVLTFAVPEGLTEVRAGVRWPGGLTEDFSGVAVRGRYLLREGAGEAVPWRVDRLPFAPQPGELGATAGAQTARIVPHSPLPVPGLRWFDGNGRERTWEKGRARGTLLLFWATWCPSCLTELGEWSQSAQDAREGGIEVIALNADDPEASLAVRKEKADPVWAKLQIPFDGGFAGTALLDGVDVLQRSILGHQEPLAIPAALLLDSQGLACAFYRGSVRVEQVLRDIERLAGSPAVFRDLAVPIPGRWFVNAFDPDYAAPVSRLLELGNESLALEYLEQAVQPRARGFARAQAGGSAAELGQRFLASGRTPDALRALRCAVQLAPHQVEVRTRLALLSESQGLDAEAADHFRELLRQNPGSLPAANSLGWILATSPDPDLRRPEEALRYATAVCEATGYAMAEPMDTLAATYAALGRFDQAVETAQRALKAAQEAGERDSATRIQERLRLYEQGRPYQSGLRR